MKSLTGVRILVVEDQPIIAMSTGDALTEMGAVVVGPACTLDEALALVDSETIDAALLDVWLGREPSYRLGAVLDRKGIPFIITAGKPGEEEPALFRRAPRVLKPFSFEELAAALLAL